MKTGGRDKAFPAPISVSHLMASDQGADIHCPMA
jgi:hypothetical protein